MLWLDLDAWNHVLVASLAVAAVAAVIVGVATFVIIRLQHAEETAAKDEFGRYQRAADARARELEGEAKRLSAETGAAKAQIAIAQNNAATANEQAALAYESAAKAHQIAEAERLERIRIEERIAPRTLPVGERAELISALSRFSGQKFVIFSLMGDAEGRSVAGQLADALSEARWDHDGPAGVSQVIRTDSPVGIQVIVSAADVEASQVPAAAYKLVETLLRFGLIKERAITKDNEPTGSWAHRKVGEIGIMVGTKPIETGSR